MANCDNATNVFDFHTSRLKHPLKWLCFKLTRHKSFKADPRAKMIKLICLPTQQQLNCHCWACTAKLSAKEGALTGNTNIFAHVTLERFKTSG